MFFHPFRLHLSSNFVKRTNMIKKLYFQKCKMGIFELFSTDSSSESNFVFYNVHIEFLKNAFFAYISTFLLANFTAKIGWKGSKKTKYI